MFRIKAIAAVALAGLGGATVGTDAYMASHPPSASSYELPKYEVSAPSTATVVKPPLQNAASSVVTLAPVTITTRLPRHAAVARVAAPPPAPEFVPCSEWRSLETGPADRRVRMLCAQTPPAAAE